MPIMQDNNTRAFIALLQAGLWEQSCQLVDYGSIDYSVVYRLASEQSVVGLIAAGLEHADDTSSADLIPFVTQVMSLEKRNLAMNSFIGGLIKGMRKNGVFAVLVKGQGIAQCYERPLWRAAGDIDLFLDETNYYKAISFLSPLAKEVDIESKYNRHQSMLLDRWTVELHGTLRSSVSRGIDLVIDDIQARVFDNKEVRIWSNEQADVYLPSPDNDVVLVFSHILQHLYNGGIGLRQICDWCRLLWTYRDSIDRALLEGRIRKMGVVSPWKAFASLAVDILGMPKEAMPLFDSSNRWKRKSRRLLHYVLKVGNFGHNVDNGTRMGSRFVIIRKLLTMLRNISFALKHLYTFPMLSTRALIWKFAIGFANTAQG